jgi:hypothetical protein
MKHNKASRYSSLSDGRMVGLVRRLIKKHKAIGHGKKLFGSSKLSRRMIFGKDWMHPKVRKTIEYMVERNVFDNKMDSRKNLSRFFEKIFEKDLLLKGKELEREVYFETKEYLFELASRKGVVNKKEFFRSFSITLDLVAQRIENLQSQIRNVNTSNKERYISSNARDSFAHAGQGVIDAGPDSIRLIKKALNQILAEK